MREVRGFGVEESRGDLDEALGFNDLSTTKGERFIEAIDGFINTRIKKDPRGRLAFRPSQIGKCRRQVYYFLKNTKGNRSLDTRVQRIFEVGDKLHEWIQEDILMEITEEFGVVLLEGKDLPFSTNPNITIFEDSHYGAADMEIKFVDYSKTKKYPISAMVDGAMMFEGEQTLFEFKTIGSQYFNLLTEPLSGHYMQGAVYALCTGVRDIIFLYLCKNTQDLKAYDVRYTDEQIEWVWSYMVGIEDMVLNNELPEKEEEKRDCTYCPYKTQCKKDS